MLSAGFEDGERDHEPRNADVPNKMEKARECTLLQSLQKERRQP